MIKTFVAAATVVVAFGAPAFADGGTGHSHPHTHPHTGHDVHAHVVDPAVQHSHGVSEIGVTHTHEVNGVRLRHTHSTQYTQADTVVDKWNRRLIAKERRYLGREVGAGFSPYTVAEWNARARAHQPGLTPYQEPWPLPRRGH